MFLRHIKTFCPECNKGSSYTTIGLTVLYCDRHKRFENNENWFDLEIHDKNGDIENSTENKENE